MLHPIALQLRNLQTLIEIGVDKNTTVVFPGPLMSTIQEMGAYLTRETGAVAQLVQPKPHQPTGAATQARCLRRLENPRERQRLPHHSEGHRQVR